MEKIYKIVDNYNGEHYIGSSIVTYYKKVVKPEVAPVDEIDLKKKKLLKLLERLSKCIDTL